MSAFWSGVDCYFDAFCVYVLIYDALHLRFSILINSLSPSLSLFSITDAVNLTNSRQQLSVSFFLNFFQWKF